MEYFIIENNGQQAGPFSQEQLVQKAITPETLVWAQGLDSCLENSRTEDSSRNYRSNQS